MSTNWNCANLMRSNGFIFFSSHPKAHASDRSSALKVCSEFDKKRLSVFNGQSFVFKEICKRQNIVDIYHFLRRSAVDERCIRLEIRENRDSRQYAANDIYHCASNATIISVRAVMPVQCMRPVSCVRYPVAALQSQFDFFATFTIFAHIQ